MRLDQVQRMHKMWVRAPQLRMVQRKIMVGRLKCDSGDREMEMKQRDLGGKINKTPSYLVRGDEGKASKILLERLSR